MVAGLGGFDGDIDRDGRFRVRGGNLGIDRAGLPSREKLAVRIRQGGDLHAINFSILAAQKDVYKRQVIHPVR